MSARYIGRPRFVTISAFLLCVKANLLIAWLAYRTRNIHKNYGAFLIGVTANLFCVVGL